MPGSARQLARELLSLCLTPARDAAPSGIKDDPASWEPLVHLAIEQGVAPLLAVRARHLTLPVAFRERLESIYSANSVRNLRLAAEESRISAALTTAGVRHWPLKGPGLSERLYADIGVRQISDVDLLIEAANLARTDALLADLGYQRKTSGPISGLSRAQELLYVRDGSSPVSSRVPVPSGREICFLDSPPSPSRLASGHSPLATAFYLDLHQRLLPYVRRDPLAARVFELGMNHENLLLYLCANQITHRFARLRYLCDVAAFLRREASAVNWDAFVAAAHKMPWGPGVGLCLQWADEFTPSRVPPEVLRSLRPNPLGDLLLRRALGADAAEAASRTRALDGPAGASVAVGAAFAGPTQLGMAWRMAFPSRAYLQEQTGAPAEHAFASTYAWRLAERIPRAIRQLFRSTR